MTLLILNLQNMNLANFSNVYYGDELTERGVFSLLHPSFHPFLPCFLSSIFHHSLSSFFSFFCLETDILVTQVLSQIVNPLLHLNTQCSLPPSCHGKNSLFLHGKHRNSKAPLSSVKTKAPPFHTNLHVVTQHQKQIHVPARTWMGTVRIIVLTQKIAVVGLKVETVCIITLSMAIPMDTFLYNMYKYTALPSEVIRFTLPIL